MSQAFDCNIMVQQCVILMTLCLSTQTFFFFNQIVTGQLCYNLAHIISLFCCYQMEQSNIQIIVLKHTFQLSTVWVMCRFFLLFSSSLILWHLLKFQFYSITFIISLCSPWWSSFTALVWLVGKEPTRPLRS